MKNIILPRTNLEASNVILGLMRIGALADEDIRSLVGQHAMRASTCSTTPTSTGPSATNANDASAKR